MAERQIYGLNPKTGRMGWFYLSVGPKSALPNHGTSARKTRRPVPPRRLA